MCGAVGESAGWRDGRDESDPIKFLLAKTLKMIRQEVREVQEGSEGGSGGRVGKGAGGGCAAIGRECTSAESARELQSGPHLSGTRRRSLSALPAGWLEEKGFCSSELQNTKGRRREKEAGTLSNSTALLAN